MVRTLPPGLLYDQLSNGSEHQLIDTRPAEVFEAWHIPGAVNLPFGPDEDLDAVDVEAVLPEEEIDIMTICGKGISSYAFAESVNEQTGREVAVIQDGMEGWSRLYDVIAIPTAAPDVEIYQFQRIAKGCLSYLICSVDSHEAAVIDPTRHGEEYQMVADDDGMTITHVIDTHIHADHISGGRDLADELDVPYHLPASAIDRDVSISFEPLAHTEVLSLGDVDIKAIHTPGHTTDATSLLIDGEAVLTNDTLFVDGVGRTELQYGDGEATTGAKSLYTSIHRSLLTLPELVTVLPGHQRVAGGEALMVDAGTPISATIERLRTELPLLGIDESTFVDRVTTGLPAKPDHYEEIIAINGGEDPEIETEPRELELGPNQCAAAAD